MDKKTIPGTATNTGHPDEIFKINVQRCKATKTKQTSSGDKMSSVKTVTFTSAVVFTLKYVTSYTGDKFYTEINSLYCHCSQQALLLLPVTDVIRMISSDSSVCLNSEIRRRVAVLKPKSQCPGTTN